MSLFNVNLSLQRSPPMIAPEEMEDQQGAFRLFIDQSSLGSSGILMAGSTLWGLSTLVLPARQLPPSGHGSV